MLAHAIDTAVSAPKSCAQDCAHRLPDRTRVRQVDACYGACTPRRMRHRTLRPCGRLCSTARPGPTSCRCRCCSRACSAACSGSRRAAWVGRTDADGGSVDGAVHVYKATARVTLAPRGGGTAACAVSHVFLHTLARQGSGAARATTSPCAFVSPYICIKQRPRPLATPCDGTGARERTLRVGARAASC